MGKINPWLGPANWVLSALKVATKSTWPSKYKNINTSYSGTYIFVNVINSFWASQSNLCDFFVVVSSGVVMAPSGSLLRTAPVIKWLLKGFILVCDGWKPI